MGELLIGDEAEWGGESGRFAPPEERRFAVGGETGSNGGGEREPHDRLSPPGSGLVGDNIAETQSLVSRQGPCDAGLPYAPA